MTCTWIETFGPYASDIEWLKHLKECLSCQIEHNNQTGDQGPEMHHIFPAPRMPEGIIESVMERIRSTQSEVAQVEPGKFEPAPFEHTRKRSQNARIQSRRRSRRMAYASAAVVLLALGGIFHTPVAQAMTYVVERIQTSFFPNDAHPMAVNVTQVTPAEKPAVEQDSLSTDEKSAADVFAKHRAEIINTYQQLQEGQTHALRFDDGTAFAVTKQTLFTSTEALRKAASATIPTLNTVPQGLKFERGTVRASGDQTMMAETNMLFTVGGDARKGAAFEYEKYTDPSFSPGKGPYISLNMVAADGILGTEYIGDFDLKKSVSVQGQPGVLMKYKDSWKPAPGIVKISFGTVQNGHHYMVTMDARGLTPDELLQVANDIQWQ